MVKDGQKSSAESAAEQDQLRKSTLLAFLRERVGEPYQYGATGNTVFDCSSLTQGAYNLILGLQDLPKDEQFARTASNQAIFWGRVIEEREPYQVGDLLFFRGSEGRFAPPFPPQYAIGHVATYVGDDRAIHTTAWMEAGHEFGEVIEESVEQCLKRRAKLVGRRSDLVIVKRVIEGDIYYHEGHAKLIPAFPAIERVE